MNAKPPYILAIDQGTTSSRAHSVRQGCAAHGARIPSSCARSIPTMAGSSTTRAKSGTRRLPVAALSLKGVAPKDVAAIGITNQRETTVLWDQTHGRAVAQRHRLAGSAHSRALPRTESPRLRSRRFRPHRPAARSLFLRHQTANGCSITSRARAPAPPKANSPSARSIAG